MTAKYPSTRIARRRTIRLMYQCIALSRKLNKKYNDGNSNADVVRAIGRVRRYSARMFVSLVD